MPCYLTQDIHDRFPAHHSSVPCYSPCRPIYPSYRINKYFAVSAKTITKALKPELATKASRRYVTEVKVQHIKDGETVKMTDLTTGKDLVL